MAKAHKYRQEIEQRCFDLNETHVKQRKEEMENRE